MESIREVSSGVKQRRTESDPESEAEVCAPHSAPPRVPSEATDWVHVMRERLFDSEWLRGCADCCPSMAVVHDERAEETAPSGKTETSVSDSAHTTVTSASVVEGCCGAWEAAMWPAPTTCVRNPWAELAAHSPCTEPEKMAAGAAAPVLVVVRTDLWDSYWAHFSLRAGPLIDALSVRLAREQTSTGGVLSRPSRRRVLLKAVLSSSTASTSTAVHAALEASTLQRVLLFHARHFGAIEFCHMERGIHHMQFTTAQAAQYFQRWIAQQLVSRLTASLPQSEQRQETLADIDIHIAAVLAPADERRVTQTLLLGPSIRLSTAHAESLLSGMMGAHEVRYRSGVSGFTAAFATTCAAKTALHVLQHSLWKMFGVPLLMI